MADNNTVDFRDGVAEVCNFLIERNVSRDVVDQFRRNKMDKSAVWNAKEEELRGLGLKERGHLICLKSFCMGDDIKEQKTELVKEITNTGKERVKKSRKNKSVTLGWMHYNESKNKYVSVRTACGGGTRQFSFSNDANSEDVLDKMKELFFPANNNSVGALENMRCSLGNFQGNILTEDFILQEYIKTFSLTKTRLYLLTKKKSRIQILRDIAIDNMWENDETDDFDMDSSPSYQLTSTFLSREDSATSRTNSVTNTLTNPPTNLLTNPPTILPTSQTNPVSHPLTNSLANPLTNPPIILPTSQTNPFTNPPIILPTSRTNPFTNPPTILPTSQTNPVSHPLTNLLTNPLTNPPIILPTSQTNSVTNPLTSPLTNPLTSPLTSSLTNLLTNPPAILPTSQPTNPNINPNTNPLTNVFANQLTNTDNDVNQNISTAEEENLQIEKQNFIQSLRKARVPSEPSLVDNHVVICVRHLTQGCLRRLFSSNAKMNNVYDWIGSLSPQPIYFRLCCSTSELIKPAEPVEKYDLTVLNMTKINYPLPLEEDEEVTAPGFSVNDENHLQNLNQKRLSAKEFLINNSDMSFSCDRHDVFHELLSIYVKDVEKYCFSISFKDEFGYGAGVTRDVYSQFYKDLFRLHSSGIGSCVPSDMNEEHSVSLGKIISHAFIQWNIFPINLSKALFEYIVFKKVRDNTLRESFLEYVTQSEKQLITSCFSKESLTGEEKDGLCDIFSDCGITMLPKASNLSKIVLNAAKNVFIQKTFFAVNSIQAGLGEFWEGITLAEIDALWTLTIPSPKNVLCNFNLESYTSKKEETIMFYLQRYVKSSSVEMLSLLLQFCTGSSSVNVLEKIKVLFVNCDERNLNISSKTCFKILYLPKQIGSFKLFKTICDETLQNPILWRLHDKVED